MGLNGFRPMFIPMFPSITNIISRCSSPEMMDVGTIKLNQNFKIVNAPIIYVIQSIVKIASANSDKQEMM